MADLSNFKRGEFIDARMTGTSVRKTAEIFGVAKNIVWKAMTAFEKEGKTFSLKQNWKKTKVV